MCEGGGPIKFSDSSLQMCVCSTSAPSVMLWAERRDETEGERSEEKRLRDVDGMLQMFVST